MAISAGRSLDRNTPDGAMTATTRDIILRLMQARGMKHQTELASAASIHPGELSRMLGRTRRVGMGHLQKIADALEVPPADLLEDSTLKLGVTTRSQLDDFIEAEAIRLAGRVKEQVGRYLDRVSVTRVFVPPAGAAKLRRAMKSIGLEVPESGAVLLEFDEPGQHSTL